MVTETKEKQKGLVWTALWRVVSCASESEQKQWKSLIVSAGALPASYSFGNRSSWCHVVWWSPNLQILYLPAPRHHHGKLTENEIFQQNRNLILTYLLQQFILYFKQIYQHQSFWKFNLFLSRHLSAQKWIRNRFSNNNNNKMQ